MLQKYWQRNIANKSKLTTSHHTSDTRSNAHNTHEEACNPIIYVKSLKYPYFIDAGFGLL